MENRPLRSTPGGVPNATQLSFEQLPHLFDTLSAVVFTLNLDGKFVHVSNSAESLWGYHPHELIGTSYLDIIVQEDRPKTQDFF